MKPQQIFSLSGIEAKELCIKQARADERAKTLKEVLMFLNEHSASEYRDLECMNWLEAELKKAI